MPDANNITIANFVADTSNVRTSVPNAVSIPSTVPGSGASNTGTSASSSFKLGKRKQTK